MAIDLTPIVDAVETALETEFSGTTLVFGTQAPAPANGSESVWVAVEFANYDYATTGIIYGLLTVNCFSHLGLTEATDLGDRAKDTLDALAIAGVNADPATTLRQVTRSGSLFQVNTTVRFTVQGLTITDFAPRQGKVNDDIIIYGSAFTDATSATINGTNIASFTVVDDSTITGVVATGTTTGRVTVTTPSGSATSSTDFLVGSFGGGLETAPVQTSAFTTEAFKRYPLNSSSASFAVTLHSPLDGDVVGFYDANPTGCFTLKPVTITGDKLIVNADNFLLKRNFECVEFVYKASTNQWAIATSQTTAFGGGGGSSDALTAQVVANTSAIAGLVAADVLINEDLVSLDGRVDDLETTLGALGNLGAGLKLFEDIYIAPENDLDAWTTGTNGITYATLQANPSFQTSDPLEADFRAFSSLLEAAKYCQENFSNEGVATLYLKPGLYFLESDFNCSIIINGAENDGTIGDYRNSTPTSLPADSVIFYQKIFIVANLASDGDKKLRYPLVSGTLSISGQGTSTIKNCHFWSSTDWLDYQDTTIEDLLIAELADPLITDSWLNDSLEYPLFPSPKFDVTNGILLIDEVVTIGATFPSSYDLLALEENGVLNTTNGGLTINSLRLRGNGLWILPIEVYDPVNDRTVLIFDDTWDGWARCDSDGTLNNSGTYRCASGFAGTLFVFFGDCSLGLGGNRYTVSATGVGAFEAGFDKNCIRLEKNWDALYGTTDTNLLTSASVTPDINWQGSDNIGVHGDTDFYSVNKSPSIRHLIGVPEADSYLRFSNFNWDKRNSTSRPGFRNVFGSWCTVTNCDNTTIAHYKTISLVFFDKAFGITFNRQSQTHNTLWVQRANSGTAPSSSATIETDLKIQATEFTQRFYLNAEECTDTGYYDGELLTKTSFPASYTL